MRKYFLFDLTDNWCRIITAENEVEAVASILSNEKNCFGWSVDDFPDGISYMDMAEYIVGQILDSRDFDCYIFDITDEKNVEVL
jgi:hypothetical protein